MKACSRSRLGRERGLARPDVLWCEVVLSASPRSVQSGACAARELPDNHGSYAVNFELVSVPFRHGLAAKRLIRPPAGAHFFALRSPAV